MIRIIVILVLAVTNAPALHASNWYASPSATGGNGSITNPWNLNIALKSTNNILPGDTLYLRDGTYQGPGFVSTLTGTSNNYITVRSYPGEWALLTDGRTGTLLTQLHSTNAPYSSSAAVIAGSENWPRNLSILLDNGDRTAEVCDLWSKSGTNWSLVRGWAGSTPANHSIGSQVIFQGMTPIISHTGSYVVFRDFEITSVITNRVINTRFNSNTNPIPFNCLCGGLSMGLPGANNKAINLIVHNVAEAAVGGAHSSEINGCIIWGTGEYDSNGIWIRGSPIYGQNFANDCMATVKNCITFRNFTSGGKYYTSGNDMPNIQFVSNISFQNGMGAIQASSAGGVVSNVWFNGNIIMGMPSLYYITHISPITNANQQYFINNILVSGSIHTVDEENSVYTNNVIFFPDNNNDPTIAPIQYTSPYFSATNLNITWDHNTYYFGSNSTTYKFAFWTKAGGTNYETTTGGYTTLANWQAVSGWDLHSSATAKPTNYLKVAVQPYDYDSNRWNICVISTSGQTNTTIALSDYGFANGQRYQLVDAQNWPVVIASGTYTNGTINLPLNLTDVSTIPGIAYHTNFLNLTNEHTNVKNPGLFNAFVLGRISPPPPTLLPPKNLHKIAP